MTIPETLKIGAIIYKVKQATKWFEHEHADGETFYDKKNGNTIFIRKTLTDDAKAITLIHEALHCMNSTVNHEFLDSLSEQLYQFLQDNNLLK